MSQQYVDVRQAVPARFCAACELCGLYLDTRADGVHQWTAGWVMQRAGGGGHGVSLPVRAQRWAHRHCVENAARGNVGQGNMFGTP